MRSLYPEVLLRQLSRCLPEEQQIITGLVRSAKQLHSQTSFSRNWLLSSRICGIPNTHPAHGAPSILLHRVQNLKLYFSIGQQLKLG